MNKWYNDWLKLAKEGKDVELLAKLNQLTEIEIDMLFNDKKLKFGTAGVRTKVGIGPTLLNEYNIFRLGLAFADTFSQENKEKGIIVLHDTRVYSDVFSKTLLKAFSHRGFQKIYVYKKNDAAITPLISYFIRKLKIGGGVMVTASHNPPEYQGIKFYNSRGIQISDSTAITIEEKLNGIKAMSFSHIKEPRTISIPNRFETEYFNMLKELYFMNKLKNKKEKAKVLVTTLQGASAPFVEKMKRNLGLDITLVQSEKEPDGRFSLAQSTNPEDFNKAYCNALQTIYDEDYDVLVAIDPDGDRLGVIDLIEFRKAVMKVADASSLNIHDFLGPKKPWCLSGNKIAGLLLEQVLFARSRKKGTKKLDGFVVRSYVTSNFVDIIGSEYGLKTYETFTGFKWIGGKVESIKDSKVVMGFEESIGYFFSNDAREKDSLQALVVLITLIERIKLEKKSLVDHLNHLFKTYKIFIDETDNIYAKISYDDFLKIINNIENSALITSGDLRIQYIKSPSGEERINLIKLIRKDNSGWIALRPSGTEPKIKAYYVFNGTKEEEIKKTISTYKIEITQIIEDYLASRDTEIT